MDRSQANNFIEPDVTPAMFRERRSGIRLRRSKTDARILACVDDTPTSSSVVLHATAVGRGLDLPITLARVVETPPQTDRPVDPVEWQIRRIEHRDRLNHIAAGELGDAQTLDIEKVVLVGAAADQLCDWAEEHRAPLLALATHGHSHPTQAALGQTSQRILERASASLLLVPPETAPRQEHYDYRKVLVPLDGSCRAESVLPLASRIARAHGAEIILAHVVPKAPLVGNQTGQAVNLCATLSAQNEQDAREYLHDLQTKLCADGLSVSAFVLPEGDVRAELRRFAIQQDIDLIVLSSHGQSGLADMPCGSVTEYLATHAPAPLFMVRPNFVHGFGVPPSGPVARTSIIPN